MFSSRVKKENTKLITSDLNDTVDITLIALTPSSMLMRTKYQLHGVPWGQTFNKAKGSTIVVQNQIFYEHNRNVKEVQIVCSKAKFFVGHEHY